MHEAYWERSMYRWIPINNIADYDELSKVLEYEYAPKYVVDRLKDSISSGVGAVLVETDYLDKDYRNTYYNYYSKKGRVYRTDCVRLHFFDELVSFDDGSFEINSPDGKPQDHYFGYVVVRPTLLATIGRSLLSPDIRKGARGHTIQSKHKVHLLGRDLEVWGFPSMDQHIDISVCAHVACWSILRHYSERFATHREFLLHDVTMLAHPFDPGGLVPATGLGIDEAERVFHAAGTFPLVVAKDLVNPSPFYRQLLAYIESGFPLFIAMDHRLHAVVALGHAWKTNPPKPSVPGPRYAWDQVDSVVVIDDNKLPYLCISAQGSASAIGQYSAADFDRFIVPLPEKIFYPADAVEKYAIRFASAMSSKIAVPPADQLIVRYFITTQSAFRRFVRENRSQFDPVFIRAVMQQPTPQFIWVVEYTSAQEWAGGKIIARAVLDATASLRDPLPVWFFHGRESAIFFDRGTGGGPSTALSLTAMAAPLGRMEQNLRPIRSR